MNKEELKAAWLEEERTARICGWDFSHINERYEEEGDLPWDYKGLIKQYLKPEHRLLDMDTGGGEFLLSLEHPYQNTAATEGYPPNVELCAEKLLALGIDFREADGAGELPFESGSFDVVINRHGGFCVPELYRVLKPGGLFLTQQVGEENDRELVEQLLPGTGKPYPGWRLDKVAESFTENDFEVLRGEEAFRPIKFYDVGALVWFARIIEWEFPGFSVERCLPELVQAQELLEQQGCVEGRIHRFLIAARKAG